MLYTIIFFLPSMVSLLWFFSFLTKKKSQRQKVFCIAEGLSIAFYALIALYTLPAVDYHAMVRMEAVSIPISLIFPVFVTSYVYMLYSGRRIKNIHLGLLLIPAIAEGAAVLSLCYLMDFDYAAEVSRQFASPEGLTGAFDTKINHFYCFLTYYVFVGLGLSYAAAFLVISVLSIIRYKYQPGDVARFIFKGKTAARELAIVFMFTLETTLVLVIMILGSKFISSHVILGVFLMTALSAIKHIIAYLEFYSDQEGPVSLDSLAHLVLDSQATNNPEAADTPALSVADIRIERFKELMDVDRIWQDENLTSDIICQKMGIGKTTLSQLVNQNYGTTLREVICQYRIEEAKRFMKAHPDAKQEYIAEHCGFKNAQYFNTLFKKMVGKTPATWLISQD